MKTVSDRLFDELATTIDLCGSNWTPDMKIIAARELCQHPEPAVLFALHRCRLEVKGRLTLADIIERIEDGRPGPDEAWAHVGTLTEAQSVVTTQEALEAWREVRDLVEQDEVGARMAFRESYRRIVTRNRAERVPVRWVPSLGHDAAEREAVLQRAAEQGKLSAPQVKALGAGAAPALTGRAPIAALPPGPQSARAEQARERFGAMLAAMGNPERMRELQESLEQQEAQEQERRDARARAAGAGR